MGETLVAKSFYSRENDSSVDDAITSAEDRFSALVAKLRSNERVDDVSNDSIAEFLAHLEVRTRHLRETMHHLSQTFFSELFDHLQDNELFQSLMIKQLADDPSILNEALENELEKRDLSVPKPQRDLITSIVLENLPRLMKIAGPSMAALTNHLANNFPGRLPSTVKEAQLRVLRDGVAPPLKMQLYSELQFKVHAVEEGLILGDGGLFFEVDSPKRFKTFLEKKDCLKNVFLPLSANKILVGSKSSPSSIPSANIINQVIAQCSLEFFMASRNTASLSRLTSMIGERARPMADEEIKTLVQKNLKT